MLFTKELQKRLDAQGVQGIAIALHPGGVRTGESSDIPRLYNPTTQTITAGSINFVGPDNLSMLDEALSPIDGALTPLFAATNNIVWIEKDKYGGAYLMPFGVIEEPSENARNPQLARELWAASEIAIKDVLAH